MNDRIKLLIPYDGSKNVEIALAALGRRPDLTGRPGEALIVVSGLWLPQSAAEHARAADARRRRVALSGVSSHVPALRRWEEERALAREAGARLARLFPSWTVTVETLPGASLVSSEILETAAAARTDLLVIGVEPFFAAETGGYGAGAVRVVKEAGCSVYLARAGAGKDDGLPVDLTVVLDGSRRDDEIVGSLTRREWPAGSRARVLATGAGPAPADGERHAAALRGVGLATSASGPDGVSPESLAEAVGRAAPDRVLLGAGPAGNEPGEFERSKLGREPRGNIEATECPVEIVRGSASAPPVDAAAGGASPGAGARKQRRGSNL